MGEKTKTKRLVIAVCCGEDCKEKDAKKLRKRLKELVKDRDLKESVKIAKAECFGECKKGPIVDCPSAPLRLHKVSPEDAETVLAQCLAGKPEKKSKKSKKTGRPSAKKKAE